MTQNPLLQVPQKKVEDQLLQIIKNCPECSMKKEVSLSGGLCQRCMMKTSIINRYAGANIPVIYWMKDIAAEFHGPDDLKNKYNDLTADIKKNIF